MYSRNQARSNEIQLLALLVVLAFIALLAGCGDQSTGQTPRTPVSIASPAAPHDMNVQPVGTSEARLASDRPTMRKDAKMKTEVAMFGAGCFWGVEAAFRKIDGVVDTAVGYSGGDMSRPTYKDVCSGRTGHAEVVRVEYDPSRVSYDKLLDLFWSSHDPTQVNRQGPDVGTQYRSVIFFSTPEQEAAAKSSKEKLDASGRFRRPIATQIVQAGEFWRAEEYHQQYLEKRGRDSCHK